ncbi:MAG: enoyl-CoA hydratase/isomerase family protein [Xanthomonadaceae bacterium]|nr:enoyl-CoA hydratase/isomerase family protein [Xanthomonadaceae bacterium]
MTQLVQIIDHGPIRELKMSRPPVNAIDDQLSQDLITGVAQAVADGARGIVLSGTERVFSAGMDVPYLLSHGNDLAALSRSWNLFFDAARALAHSPVPVAVSMGGHSPAGGCVLALCCDYRVMARSADPARPYAIGLNEVQVGLPVPEGVQRLLRRTVGARTAERLLIGGGMVPTEQALKIGLIDELADGPEVTARAVAWLQSLLKLPSAPMLYTRAVGRADLLEALRPEILQLEAAIDMWHSPDAQAGLHALATRLGK